MEEEARLTAAETAGILGISSATVRNWVRHGYLDRSGGGFRREQVLELQERIRRGEINRLNSRANKRETGGKIKAKARFRDLCEELLKLKLPAGQTMWLVAVSMFRNQGRIKNKPIIKLMEMNASDFSEDIIYLLLKKRLNELMPDGPTPEFSKAAIAAENIEIPRILPAETDIAGIIYQALCERGRRSASGSFYTPPALSDEMINTALQSIGKQAGAATFIDPCCGSGQFILSFLRMGGNPENAVGMDSDPNAAFAAASNIMLQCPALSDEPAIFTADSLLTALPADKMQSGSFDLAVTNPPWGAATSGRRQELSARFPAVKSGESFSYFINRCLEYVRPGGAVSLVLPESVTNVKRHSDIREFILSNSRVNRIEEHGSVFKKVFTPVITIELIKNTAAEDYSNINAPAGSEGFSINNDFTFSININRTDADIIDHLYSIPHTSLEGKADWALGIVTGNNSLYLSKEKKSGWEPVIRGSDISRGRIKAPSQYIDFNPGSFQQTAPEWKYRAPEKLVYRFISKHPVFAVDTERRLTLNSANIIIPDDNLREAGWTAGKIAALFNSEIFSFLYRKRFNSVKMLRSHLEQLPLPDLTSDVVDLNTFGLMPSQLDYIHSCY